jgi:replication factor C subunit 3/5
MPFLIDKYRPNEIDEIFFHEKIIELIHVMSKDDSIPNIIFYGPNGSGKKTMIKLFLQMLFDSTINKTKEVNYKVTGSGNKTTIEKIKQSTYHIEIDPKSNNSDRYLIHDVIKEYAKRKSLNVFKTYRPFKVVVINNIDNMSYYAQASLRRTMERYNDKCRFVMWCTSLSKVTKPLQSRCICLRIPSPSDLELMNYLVKISAKEKIYLDIDTYGDILRRSNGNINNALWELEFYKHGYSMSTNYDESISKIIKLMINKDLYKINEVRNMIFNLMITNYEATTILRDIVDHLCIDTKISDYVKQKIIWETAEFEYQLVKGRRHILQFDAFIGTFMNILDKEGEIKN